MSTSNFRKKEGQDTQSTGEEDNWDHLLSLSTDWNDTECIVEHEPSARSSISIEVLSKKEVLIEVQSKKQPVVPLASSPASPGMEPSLLLVALESASISTPLLLLPPPSLSLSLNDAASSLLLPLNELASSSENIRTDKEDRNINKEEEDDRDPSLSLSNNLNESPEMEPIALSLES